MGHVLHFEEAASLGDILVVTITADKFITKKRSVSFTEEYRMRQVAALEIVDYVALVSEPSAVPALEALQPDVYVKGSEYANLVLDKTANIFREKHLVEAYGGRIHFTTGETFSSTKLSHFLLASPEAVQDNPLLRNERVLFRDLSEFSYQLEEIKTLLVRASQLRVCLLGETIVDEWVDISVTNLSQKSRCVAGQETARIQQIGATGIIALHLSSFVKQIDCFTNGSLGSRAAECHGDGRSAGARSSRPDSSIGKAGRRCSKRRCWTFPTYRGSFPTSTTTISCWWPISGTACSTPRASTGPSPGRRRAFVAAMAQVNSSNYGYNLPVKYVGADYYSLNRTEAELSLHEKDLPFDELLERMAAVLKCRSLSVTDGKQGVAVRMGDDLFSLPTLSTSVIDTIGCGDAYFALSSVAACLGLPARLVALAGSIAAAAMTQRRCNERPVTEQEFMTIAKIVI